MLSSAQIGILTEALFDKCDNVRIQAMTTCVSLFNKYRTIFLRIMENQIVEKKHEMEACVSILGTIDIIVNKFELKEEEMKIIFDFCFNYALENGNLNYSSSKYIINIIKKLFIHYRDLVIPSFSSVFTNSIRYNSLYLLLYLECLKIYEVSDISIFNQNIKGIFKWHTLPESKEFLHIHSALYEYAYTILSEKEEYRDTMGEMLESIVKNVFPLMCSDFKSLSNLSNFVFLSTKIIILAPHTIINSLTSSIIEKSLVFIDSLDLYSSFIHFLNTLFHIIKERNLSIPPNSLVLIPPIIKQMKENDNKALEIMGIIRLFSSKESLEKIISMKNTNLTTVLKSIIFILNNDGIKSQEDISKISDLLTYSINAKHNTEVILLIIDLWRISTLLGVDTNSLYYSLISMISVSQNKEAFEKFDLAIPTVSKSLQFKSLLKGAVDFKCIHLSPSTFSAIKESQFGNPIDHSQELMEKLVLYSYSPFFSVKTRSDIMFCLSKVIGNPDFEAASQKIYKKQCPYCAHRAVHNAVLSIVSIRADCESWVSSINYIVEQISKEVLNGNSLLTQSQISCFRAAAFSFITTIYSVGTLQQLSPQIISNYYSKFDWKRTEEIIPVTMCLDIISKWNYQLSSELFKQKTDIGKIFNSKDPNRRAFVLEYLSRSKSIDSATFESLFEGGISQLTLSHAQKRIIKRNGIVLPDKHLVLVDKLLTTNDLAVANPCLSTFLTIIRNRKSGNDQCLGTPLKKVFSALRIPGGMALYKQVVLEILSATPIEINFNNICVSVFNDDPEFSLFAVDVLIDLVKQCKQQTSLKSPAAAVSVSILLCNPLMTEHGKYLSQNVFQSNRPPHEFALQYYLSSNTDDIEVFVPFLFSLLNLKSPWDGYVQQVIASLAKDVRFSKIIDLALLHFSNSISNTTKDYSIAGTALYSIDKTKFINSLLLRPGHPLKSIVSLLSSMFDLVGTTVLEIGLKTSQPTNIHPYILKIIGSAKIFPEIKNTILVYIVHVMSIKAGTNDDIIFSLKSLSLHYPCLNNESIDSILSDRDEKGFSFSSMKSLLHIAYPSLTIYDINPLIRNSPTAALVGYSELVSQGRPLLTDILTFAKTAPNSVLQALPSVKELPNDRYGVRGLNDMFEFITNEMYRDEEAFKCMIELFSWLPEDVVFGKLELLVNSVIGAVRTHKPPLLAFSFITLLADSPLMSGRKEFIQSIPVFEVLTLLNSESDDMHLSATSRTAFCSIINYSQKKKTAQALVSSVNILNGFLESIMPIYVSEMDLVSLDCAFLLLEIGSTIVKINSSLMICAAVQQKKGMEKLPHLKLIPLLSSIDNVIKKGVLHSLKLFPPK